MIMARKGHILPDGSGCFVATVKTPKIPKVKPGKTLVVLTVHTNGMSIKRGRKTKFTPMRKDVIKLYYMPTLQALA